MVKLYAVLHVTIKNSPIPVFKSLQCKYNIIQNDCNITLMQLYKHAENTVSVLEMAIKLAIVVFKFKFTHLFFNVF